MYFSQIYADHNHYMIYTDHDIVNPEKTPDASSPDFFRVWLRNSANDNALNLAYIKRNNYSLKWCGIGSTSLPAPSYAMCCGSSRSKQWTGNKGGTSLDINTAGCGWEEGVDASRIAKAPPWYFTTLRDTANGKSASIRTAPIYNPVQTGFRTYLAPLPGQPAITPNLANNYNFDVQWCAVKPMAGTTGGAAGYPCTAPRVIVGNGDQAVQTNNAKICCEKTGSSGWKVSGKSGTFLEKTIDISLCNMKKVHVTLVNVRGDEGSVDHTGGAGAFSMGSDPNLMKVNVWTNNGKYKFYDAERFHWHVQYCLVGI
mmetsp:Transcript_77684/g.125998  ORF Transcript_77684/g.125998 Transcript_77684/m.125998 type:complete len:313 (+) Transcript_77684:2-940(+)